MTVDDVLEGLKHCNSNSIETCHRCPYCGVFNCNNKLKEDAASLIKQLLKTLKSVQKNSEINFRMWKEAMAKMEVQDDKA